MTARLHLALADAFGEHDAICRRARDAGGGRPRREAEPAPSRVAIRVHGDYHLRRVMRIDAGWLVVGFGDDPSRGGGRRQR